MDKPVIIEGDRDYFCKHRARQEDQEVFEDTLATQLTISIYFLVTMKCPRAISRLEA